MNVQLPRYRRVPPRPLPASRLNKQCSFQPTLFRCRPAEAPTRGPAQAYAPDLLEENAVNPQNQNSAGAGNTPKRPMLRTPALRQRLISTYLGMRLAGRRKLTYR